MLPFNEWLQTPAGRYLSAWEQHELDSVVADVFGYHALQLGLPGLTALRANRIPHQWVAVESWVDGALPAEGPVALAADFSALPFPEASLDLVVLPHTLEQCLDPHLTLREVERVLVPEGRLVILGFNPASLWGLRERRDRGGLRLGRSPAFLPASGELLGFWRLRDWLRLLSFEVESARFGCYRPSVQTEPWLQRWSWMDQVGPRWWPIFGGAYMVVAVKRVRGMRLLGPSWRRSAVGGAAPVTAMNSSSRRASTRPGGSDNRKV